MNKQLRIVCLVFLAVLGPAGRVTAQNVVMPWSAFHSGGGRGVSPQLFLTAAYGQAVVGRAVAGNTVLESGFLATRILLGPITEIPEQPPSGLPTEFSLSQNYPNPFNPSTTIRFSIPVGTYGHTSLRVFDMLGREVATLVNEAMKPGSYMRVFDASGLASGVYFYTLKTSEFVQTKRLVLLK